MNLALTEWNDVTLFGTVQTNLCHNTWHCHRQTLFIKGKLRYSLFWLYLGTFKTPFVIWLKNNKLTWEIVMITKQNVRDEVRGSPSQEPSLGLRKPVTTNCVQSKCIILHISFQYVSVWIGRFRANSRKILNLVSVSLADHWVDCVSVSDSRVCSSWFLYQINW